MAAYAKHDGAFFSQRAIFLIVIVLVHIALIYLFESGLVSKAVKAIDPPIAVDIVQEQKKIDAPPPPPPPKMEHPPVEIPPPDVVIDVPVAQNTTAIRETTTQHVAPPPPPAPPAKPDVRTAAALDIKHSPSTDDYYPPTSRRMNETGRAIVGICADTAGKVSGEPKLVTSSGSSRLDEAAVRWASHARLTPGTLNGQAVASCANFAVVFKLTD